MSGATEEMPTIERFGAPYFFFSNDVDYRITFLSGSVEAVLGYPADQLIGRRIVDFLVAEHEANIDLAVTHEQRFNTDGRQSHLRAVRDIRGAERVLAVQTYGEKNEAGRVYRSRGMAQDVTAWYRHYQRLRKSQSELAKRVSELSHRDRPVLRMIAKGYLNKQIAKELRVSMRTVENRRRSILLKLGLDHMAGAIAIESHLSYVTDLLDSLEHPPNVLVSAHTPLQGADDAGSLQYRRDSNQAI
ncbi:LuxR C-terminal-related transcriptional regulator [Roseiconus lacunae]|uniref:LuxR C-terminal-related transcriptional regulator n=1 Tax=Roseiconus lacunae TaxID=2605694 RepID=A0ABT7PQL7_9BACT|nr:LuxR C-terminal-related transcriptional regulator [Roseiconus lacunae]MDM4018809.1 LuxR C-terminal-related transcriptional regulator [Roseiconus lacunae]